MLIVCLTACGGPGVEAPRLVVLVTLDTLRADHLPFYGYPRDTAPFLAGLADDGVTFEAAYSNIATTAPAHASMFTSRYPVQHGVTSNGRTLDPGFETLAERLASVGYLTVAVASTNRHFLEAGIMQGFLQTDEPPVIEGESYRPADETVDVAMAHLAPVDGPAFLWVHLFDPHGPYRSSEAADRLATTGDADRLLRHLVDRQGLDLTFFASPDAAVELMNAYDAEIVHADRHLRRLWEFATDRIPRSDMVWVVTADHGEGLGHHGWLGHGKHIYQEQLHVPLLVWGPGRAARGARRAVLTTHVDLAPTVLDLVGAPGASVFGEGRSLVPWLSDPVDADSGGWALAERRGFDEAPAGADPRWEAGQKWALQDGRYKLIHSTVLGDELFDVRADPYERRNLADSEPAVATRYRRRLDALLTRVAASAHDSGLVSEETLEGLRSLGYIR